ncbi:uncharacterized protein A1O9_01918 [Exophiala aquamarina CBS 119918]|uniref:Major facilitator superfamily (MFS) profile domain-containing protein n=1 Tax=Exophiala aquamarina CBS 119918 TaxID=1182545 RepID=A0A072PM08_9EURO|nr:uncharacterized protein A1O9_01918 [Exophiala aquamarina CBS 119918]KEF60358.1 hypothetical protein A1O9_01918 [Exophiala aquamarina CBS 119918]
MIGGLVLGANGWRWTQWTTIFFILAFYLPIIFTKETYKKAILQTKARTLGSPNSMPELELGSLLSSTKYFATTLLVRPVHMILTEPIVTLVCMYNAFLFAMMYTFVVASPWVFEHYYHFDMVAQALSFLGLMGGTALAPVPLILIDTYIYQPRLKQFRREFAGFDRHFPPEHRLYPGVLASFTLPAFLFGFAWTARPSIHWIVPIILEGLTILAAVMIYSSANLFMMDSYGPLYGASASGAAMLSRYGLSAAFPLFALQLYKALGVSWSTSLLAFCTLAMAPIPWLFWYFGEQLRGKTKYETSG